MTSTKAIALRPQQDTSLARTEVVEPMTWPDMVKMGEQLVRTRMLPEHVKDGASAALIMLTGRELGMAPMRALRSLSVVKGKVIESADSQLARFKSDGGRAEFKVLDDTKAVLWLKHPNGDEHTETWTAADSQKAGLAGGMHSKFAKAMYRSRAITAGLKSLGWEGGVGAYDPDEARGLTGGRNDDGPAPAATTTPVATASAVYKADDARRGRVNELLAVLEITEGQRAYIEEVCGGAMPSSDDHMDALISELETRAEEYLRAKSATVEGA